MRVLQRVCALAPAGARGRIAAVVALDEAFARLLRTTTQPLIGQMRLAWWHERLSVAGAGDPPAEPVLRALAEQLGPDARPLAAMIDGWDVLLDETLDPSALTVHGDARGGGLGRAIGRALGGDERRAEAVGRAWALADLAGHLSKAAERDAALVATRDALGGLPRRLGGSLAPMQPMLDLARSVAGARPGLLIRIKNRLAGSASDD